MKNTFKVTQMFNVTCNVTGSSVKVRKPVYMKRIEKVQRLVRQLGKPITREEAIIILNDNYVSNVGRKLNNVDFLGNEIGSTIIPVPRIRKPKTEDVVSTPLTEEAAVAPIAE